MVVFKFDCPTMATVNGDGKISILDIRQGPSGLSLVNQMRDTLNPGKGQEKKLPTLLLYDEKGLTLFEDITYLDEYYLTNAEIEVLERYADQIVEQIQAGSMVVELGSGYDVPAVIELEALQRETWSHRSSCVEFCIVC